MNTESLLSLHEIFGGLNAYAVYALLGLSLLYLISGLDDFFVDLVALIAGLKPQELSSKEMRLIHRLRQRRIAIIVPAWHEGEIIDRMLTGNLDRIDYKNFDIFVGCYPNDPLTAEKVREVGQIFPNVHAVVNYKPGPTSKGQILNYVVEQIEAYEEEKGVKFDALLMQDAEDLIHPKTLKLVNANLSEYAFVQVPVFSLEVHAKELVAGTYVDEFAESHTKDILVRDFLGAAVPSAGVGTALSRTLVDAMRRSHGGQLFNESSVTEDYELGVRAHNLGHKPHFAAVYYRGANGEREYIATREFFPKRFTRSIRQKTRWTIGIAFQARKNLGWLGSPINRYFLLRDRKGPITNLITFAGYPVVIFAGFYANFFDSTALNAAISEPVFGTVLVCNALLMVNRVVQRTVAVIRVYGVRAALPIPIRWPLAVVINAAASFHAIKNTWLAGVRKVQIAWAKTDHELPQFFGRTVTALEAARG